MTKRQFVVLAFRLFALYLLFTLLPNIGYIFNFMHEPLGGGLGEILAAGFNTCITLFFISLLWRKSEWLMEKIFAIPTLSEKTMIEDSRPDSTDGAEYISGNSSNSLEIMDYYETPISFESLQLIALSIFGLWAATINFPKLLAEIDLFLKWSHEGNYSQYSIYSGRTIMPLVGDFIEVALGVWLFLRPWQFQGWIEKFKPKGDLDEGTDSKRSS